MARLLLTVDLKAIESNIRKIAHTAGCRIIAVLKANAYGMGAEGLGPYLDGLDQVYGFAVSCPLEGVDLRKAGVTKPILVLTGILEGEVPLAEKWHLTPVVSDPKHLKALRESPLSYHVKYDTGMGRLGFLAPQNHDSRIIGVMSHLSSVTSDPAYTRGQLERFQDFLKAHDPLNFVHIQNSAAVSLKPPGINLVRVGIAMFGEAPSRPFEVLLDYALELKACVVSVKTLPKGSSLSYNRSHILQKDSRVAVVNIGYADGLMRSLSGKGCLWFDGKPAKILGDITMDMTLVDATGIEVQTGDWAVVVNASQPYGTLADLAGTIPYELMCNLSSRTERVYNC